jgi:hypothetical protein
MESETIIDVEIFALEICALERSPFGVGGLSEVAYTEVSV